MLTHVACSLPRPVTANSWGAAAPGRPVPSYKLFMPWSDSSANPSAEFAGTVPGLSEGHRDCIFRVTTPWEPIGSRARGHESDLPQALADAPVTNRGGPWLDLTHAV
jgi:hypothetical protein